MKIEKVNNLAQLRRLLPILESLSDIYPDITSWYINKVIPRTMFSQENIVLMIKNENNQLCGFAIGKKTTKETKLSCLYILEDYRKKGYGTLLINEMLIELEETNPHCTVSEELFHSVSKLFVNKFEWSLDEVKNSVYRTDKLEYFFNGKEKPQDLF